MRTCVAKVAEAILTSGLVLGHVGTRAATLETPVGCIRVTLEDIAKLEKLLKEVKRCLSYNP